MLIQYIRIKRVKEGENWNAQLKRYRNSMRIAVSIFLILVVVGNIAILYEVRQAYKGDGIVTRADDGDFIYSLYSSFSRADTPWVVLLISFFTGVIKLFVERAADDDTKIVPNLREKIFAFFKNSKLQAQTVTRDLAGSVRSSGGDSWFVWFVLSLCFVIINALIIGGGRPAVRIGENELLTYGVVAVSVIGLGYFCWVYMVLFHKLTSYHHFSGRTARLFLGGLFREGIPRQAILIGPPGSGKTTFLESEPAPVTSTEIRIKTRRLDELNEDGDVLDATVIDVPGENMGDHITLCTLFRADTLVFMVDLGWLDPEALGSSQNYSIRTWGRLIQEGANLDAKYSEARTYLEGFYYASKRDRKLIDADQIYKVRSFILYLNLGAIGQRAKIGSVVRSLDHDALDQLCQDIGDRFGVPEKSCCWIVGDSMSAAQSVELFALTTPHRKERAQRFLANLGGVVDVPDNGLADNLAQN